ncbi:NTPase KAP family P-loop domain-containing protein 1 [Takifugu flavidus]|uniref:NTPase KAP family P-loop domain-containing protein 1 n=1 Tax=Takifugu flavidus TaxID=433684 RepID=UPI0025449801|nr:NTPase KAP family P-loop domain-containing protein 1 [Takifugu flavidus]XP_056881472.1 NTPase KAP family P-loop domain-containing protein 1 [Takifugu flavidus]XP_056881473.1 NTPase KAP family P-loop domain-containing protein 1 [Takifugu flavidus]XP_056881474.1 NTPase KAP family P-loop domain-containing protein 1 [Takifugu flavidus]
MYEPTTDDIYAYALSKALTRVSAPATVGLYSACQNRITRILKKIEVYMTEEASRTEQEYRGRSRPRSIKPSLCGLLALIGRMLFYKPVWTKTNQHHPNVRFIYVHFSAWHFAGSDLLWAGIAMRLVHAMQWHFGKLQMVLYRVGQHNSDKEEEDVKEKIVIDGPHDWRSKKVCCCPLWSLALVLLLIPIVIVVFHLTSKFPKTDTNSSHEGPEPKNHVGVLEGLIIAALGVPAASGLRFAFQMCKNLIFSQDLNIRRGMDNERISTQLGFMNDVRKEIWFLSRFVHFMEVFERRRIRVVLKITNLDRCTPTKIVAVLEAINILLSDEESPFISILAVNPEVLMRKINFADCCFSKEDRAHALLNCIVTLAFTVPPLGDDSKRALFNGLVRNCEDRSTGRSRQATRNLKVSSSAVPLVEISLERQESYPLVEKTSALLEVKNEEVEMWIRNILISNERCLNKYMSEDTMFMRRVFNSIRVTVIIMKALKIELPQPEHVAAWVVLANQWPCRLSWIIQCVEDAEQRADIDHMTGTDDSKTLWKVFSESKAELYIMSAQIEDLLELDGDPEMFERFLTVDFEFTVNDLKTYEMTTVNLDHTIKTELAQIRGTSRLKDSGWMRNLAPLPITTIINMATQDVCKEMERMKYPSKYIDKVRSHGLDGPALVFGDVDDLKDLLDMTFGEWATFRLHFLGLKPHHQAQNKKSVKKSAQAYFPPRFPLHVANQYSSNPCLATCST